MTQTVLGTFNQSKYIAGPAAVYIAPWPTGGYTGTTDALRTTALKALFYTDSATDADRLPLLSQYSDIEASGVDIKFKPNPITFDPNNRGKYTVANGILECSVSWSYKDMDANKIIDAFSAISGTDTVSTAAGAGVAARTTVIVGRQSAPLLVALCVRYPSEITSPTGVQEYRNIYIPMATMAPELEIKIDKKGAASAKITATAIGDMSLIGTQSMPPVAFIDDVTAKATS